MGLIVPQIIKVRTNGRTCQHYRDKGYEFKKCGDFIEVDVFDLPKSSHEMVKIICDICGNETKICYKVFIENRKKGILISCGSDSCKHKKYEDTCIKRYDVKNVAQSQDVQNKIKETNSERYGYECALLNKEIMDKIRETCTKKYGVDNPSKAQEVKDKKKKTCQLHYGCDCSLQDKGVREKSIKTWQEKYGKDVINPGQAQVVKEKIKQTNLGKYGVENPFASEEIKEKIRDTWSFNGHDGPCSRQQKYIANLINGKINAVISGYWADIFMEKENIVIEYDGSGHFLKDKMNGYTLPTKESLLYEKQREDKIINDKHRMIRFIATKDRIPSDEIIINLIEGFKNSNFKVIRIDFEEGIIDRDYQEKWYCNFGKLRRISKKDLKPFEKQKEKNTLKTSKN